MLYHAQNDISEAEPLHVFNCFVIQYYTHNNNSNINDVSADPLNRGKRCRDRLYRHCKYIDTQSKLILGRFDDAHE